MNTQASQTTQQLYDPGYLNGLSEKARARSQEYHANQPYPHIVLDDFLPPSVAQEAIDCFPGPRDLSWQDFNDPQQIKLAYAHAASMPAPLREILQFANSTPMLEFLEQLTGIPNLIADPHLLGGGLHQIKRGGHLDVHADFNKHTYFQLDRRLNLLIYLNQDWPEEYGGHFELWDREMTHCVKKVLPIFNRCTIFSTTDYSYHGHPDPLTCPADRSRKSLALYYYTNGRPEDEVSEAHSTLFRQRPEDIQPSMLKKIVRGITPPIITDAIRAIRG